MASRSDFVAGIPFIFQDRTGQYLHTDFDEIYDRMFLSVKSSSSSAASAALQAHSPSRLAFPSFSGSAPAPPVTTRIFNSGSRPRGHLPEPAAILDFGPGGVPGTVLFVKEGLAVQMADWVRSGGMLGRCVFVVLVFRRYRYRLVSMAS